jgi:hypothetical protein
VEREYKEKKRILIRFHMLIVIGGGKGIAMVMMMMMMIRTRRGLMMEERMRTICMVWACHIPNAETLMHYHRVMYGKRWVIGFIRG